MAGSLDDLDRLLEEELAGGHSSQQRVSLEEQVLSRVSLTEKQERLKAEPDEVSTPDLAGSPLEQFLDRLIPFLEELEQHLHSEPLQEVIASSLRSRLAEELISLPEVEGIEKAGVFAAVASCLDAGMSGRPMVARERIGRLLARVESVRDESLHRRMLAAAEFVQREDVDLKESP